MYLPQPVDLTPMGEKYRSSMGFIHGEDERGVFKLALDYSLNATITSNLVSTLDRFINAAEGVDQQIVTPEEAKEDYGIEMDRARSLDHVKYLAQLRHTTSYIENQLALKRNDNNAFQYWSQYMGGILAGALADPVLLFSGGVTATTVRAGTKLRHASRVGDFLFNKNPLIKGASRTVAFGGPEAVLNIAQGYNFSKQLNQEYDNSQAVIDGFLGLAIGTGIAGLSLRGVDSSISQAPKVPKAGEKVELPDGDVVFKDELFQAYADDTSFRISTRSVKNPQIVEFMDELLNYAVHNAHVSEAILNQTEFQVRELIERASVESWTPKAVKQKISEIIDNMEEYLSKNQQRLDLEERMVVQKQQEAAAQDIANDVSFRDVDRRLPEILREQEDKAFIESLFDDIRGEE